MKRAPACAVVIVVMAASAQAQTNGYAYRRVYHPGHTFLYQLAYAEQVKPFDISLAPFRDLLGGREREGRDRCPACRGGHARRLPHVWRYMGQRQRDSRGA
jgi:hypothetical protein